MKEEDSSGNEIRYYEVVYTRLMVTGERIKCNVTTSEWQLQSMLYDFTSRYLFCVESAKYLPNYQPPTNYDEE